MAAAREITRLRREPPAFRRVSVRRVALPTPFVAALTFVGSELEGFSVPQPAASLRLLLPGAGNRDLVMPVWNGNEFLLPDGTRPVIRTFTPLRPDPDLGTIDLEIVLHDSGLASDWARSAQFGDPAAISGPGRGYQIGEATSYLLGGDESAVPAIGQLLESLPRDASVLAHIEVTHPGARRSLPPHPCARVLWHQLPEGAPPGEALVGAIAGSDLDGETRVWVAGEAAAVQRIRRHLFTERSVDRARATVRGYWKHGRGGH